MWSGFPIFLRLFDSFFDPLKGFGIIIKAEVDFSGTLLIFRRYN